MARPLKYFPEMAVFLVGMAAGALAGPRRQRTEGNSAALDDLRKSVADLESRLAARDNQNATRFEKLESRLDEHAAKIAEMPSTTQIVAAMEQILSKTMASLDGRLKEQAQTIDVLKTTVTQTDGLLERVLESLDSLQSPQEPAEVFAGAQAGSEPFRGAPVSQH